MSIKIKTQQTRLKAVSFLIGDSLYYLWCFHLERRLFQAITKIAFIAYEGLRSQTELHNIQIIASIPLDGQQCHATVYFKEWWTWTFNHNRLLKILSSRIFTVSARRLFTHDSNVWRHIVVTVWNWIKICIWTLFFYVNLSPRQLTNCYDVIASTPVGVHRKGNEVEASKLLIILSADFFAISMTNGTFVCWRHCWPLRPDDYNIL